MTANNTYSVERGAKDSTDSTTFKSTLCHQVSGVIIFAIGLGIGVIIGVYAIKPTDGDQCLNGVASVAPAVVTTPRPVVQPATNKTSIPSCPADKSPTRSSKSEDKGMFELLSKDEMNAVKNFLKAQGHVSITEGTPTLKDSYIYGMSLYAPYKSQALNHLDKGGPNPGRYADVHVHRGNRAVPDLMEYRVGPLGGAMTAQAMYRDGELPYNSRPRDGIEWDGITATVSLAMATLRPLLQESFDGAFYPNGGLVFHPQAPPSLQANERGTRFVMAFIVDGTARGRDLNFLPLTGTVHNPGVNTNTWYAHSLYYLDQGPFPTAEALLSAYNNGTLRKVALPRGYRQTLFSTTYPKQNNDKHRESSDKAPPRSYYPSGQRYSIHDHAVKWMDWEFVVGSSQFRGPSVYDVKFKGERIVYENSLNDVTLAYASDVTSGANTIYMDATFGVGEFQSLIPGVDCPHHATLLDAAWFDSYSQSPISANAICVFETAGEHSLWRRKDKFAAGMANNFLVVRTALPVGNYDYTIDFLFFLDGSLKTDASASGYLQSSFWDPENPRAGQDKAIDAFGYRVGDYVHGAIHDHTFGFKVDMDILGTENSFDIIKWKAGDVATALKTQANVTEKPSYFLYNETRYVEWETLATEAGLKIDLNHPEFWTVMSENKNKWGVKRGYRIAPETLAAQVLTDQHPSMKATSYTKYHCVVTKQDDAERFLTGTYDLNRLADPMVSIDNYINNEPIVKTDLVTWVVVGFLHIPTSEDVPMTIGPTTGHGNHGTILTERQHSICLSTWTPRIDRSRSAPLNRNPVLSRKQKTVTFVNNCFI
ncbi:amiloride-sensitive amine oxidase [copper-containing]-like [Haliotis rubra]|uniref:amiloride-sensitive amine oxidase [copper-containing]-like n=1 Tax=Haliotis rubra TaxID=36100 RepID=UPI001EE5D93F|nr:amiloride-sensitive amine oxidase [copper-containing]-like [Haliotis rubra]